jgi:hypothetical protein
MVVKIIVLIFLILFIIALALPFLPHSHSSSPVLKARCDITSIVTAAKSYETTYGELPWANSDSDMIFGDSNKAEYNMLFDLLSSVDGPGPEHPRNARKIRFIDIDAAYQHKGFAESWGNRFKIYLDTNYDGKISLGNKAFNTDVLVYSYGKNGKDDNGQNDDICSWEKSKN